MPRYIDADELRDSFDNYEFTEYSDYSNVIDMIDDAPTADVEPVRHGHWIHKSGDHACEFECSACKTEVNDIPTLMGKPLLDYCPYCGAKMYGGGQK